MSGNRMNCSLWYWLRRPREFNELVRYCNAFGWRYFWSDSFSWLDQRELTTSQFRFLRKIKLAWLVPFYMAQENYSQHSRTRILLWVWRFGRRRWEVWTLNEGIRMDWIDDLRDKGGTRTEVYDRIELSGELTEATTDWEHAKGLV